MCDSTKGQNHKLENEHQFHGLPCLYLNSLPLFCGFCDGRHCGGCHSCHCHLLLWLLISILAGSLGGGITTIQSHSVSQYSDSVGILSLPDGTTSCNFLENQIRCRSLCIGSTTKHHGALHTNLCLVLQLALCR